MISKISKNEFRHQGYSFVVFIDFGNFNHIWIWLKRTRIIVGVVRNTQWKFRQEILLDMSKPVISNIGNNQFRH